MHPHDCQNVKIGAAAQNKGAKLFQSSIKTKPPNAPKTTQKRSIKIHPIQDDVVS
jgi:hypothetical protein